MIGTLEVGDTEEILVVSIVAVHILEAIVTEVTLLTAVIFHLLTTSTAHHPGATTTGGSTEGGHMEETCGADTGQNVWLFVVNIGWIFSLVDLRDISLVCFLTFGLMITFLNWHY
jgi:hypothetical protein